MFTAPQVPKGDPFANMAGDDFGTLPPVTTDVKALVESSFQKVVHANPELHRETCGKCGGSGRYRSRSQYGTECFACKGAGYKEYKTSAATRAKAKVAKLEREKAKQAKIVADFEAANPDIAEWWTGNTFDFAVQMRANLVRFGSLTPGQIDACKKLALKLKAAKADRAAHLAALPVLNVQHIVDAFARAMSKGIKRPKLRLFSGTKAFIFSRAPDASNNAGALYVKGASNSDDEDAGVYLGKIAVGKFNKSRDCSPETEAEIIKVCLDPAQAAIAYGKQYGSCSVCGRELTDGESIRRGIGPICASKLFG